MNSKRAINFDLSTVELKKLFGSTAEAYNQIKTFMLANGFEHRQYSGYVSKESLSDNKVFSLIKKLSQTLPWLSRCVKEFDVTNITAQFSMKETIIKSAKMAETEIHEPKLHTTRKNRK